MNTKTKALSRPKLKIKPGRYLLTKRQIEYLSLAALGNKNLKIAKSLCVTQSTVKKTLEIIFKRLHAKDRCNAVAMAFIHGVLDVNVLNNVENKYLKKEKALKEAGA